MSIWSYVYRILSEATCNFENDDCWSRNFCVTFYVIPLPSVALPVLRVSPAVTITGLSDCHLSNIHSFLHKVFSFYCIIIKFRFCTYFFKVSTRKTIKTANDYHYHCRTNHYSIYLLYNEFAKVHQMASLVPAASLVSVYH